MADKENFPDNRQYKRLPNNLPVDYSIVRLQGDLPGLNWEKGSTRNASRGGLCLKTVCLQESTIQYLAKESVMLELKIHLPGDSQPIRAVGEVAWFEEINDDVEGNYMVGLSFRSIAPSDLDRILGHPLWLKIFSLTILLLAIATVLFLIIYKYI